MTRLLAAVVLVCATAFAPSAQTEPVHTFQVRDGQIYLDGEWLPDAIPEGLDLEGQTSRVMEFSGPITPVLQVDGLAYVLEDGRLVLLSESSRAGQGYILSEPVADAVEQMPEERVMPIVEEAYMRDVAERDRGLFDRMQRERRMEADVETLAARVRAQPAGAPRAQLRRQLRGLLSDLLALKHEIRAQEIAVAEQRLDAARQSLADREDHHDEMVDMRLRELVGEE